MCVIPATKELKIAQNGNLIAIAVCKCDRSETLVIMDTLNDEMQYFINNTLINTVQKQ